MKVSKIIYFVGAPFNKRDYKRFGVDTFIEEGFEVFVWDVTPLLYSKTYMETIPPDPITYKSLKRFYDKKDAIDAIEKDNRNTDRKSVV